MKRKIFLLLLLFLIFNIGVQAQKISVNRIDKFTKDKVVYTSYEKISSEAFIGTQTGKNIWICFGLENGLNFILLKWLTAESRYVNKGSKVIFLDEEENHMYSKFQITYLEMVRDSWSIRHGFMGSAFIIIRRFICF